MVCRRERDEVLASRLQETSRGETPTPELMIETDKYLQPSRSVAMIGGRWRRRIRIFGSRKGLQRALRDLHNPDAKTDPHVGLG